MGIFALVLVAFTDSLRHVAELKAAYKRIRVLALIATNRLKPGKVMSIHIYVYTGKKCVCQIFFHSITVRALSAAPLHEDNTDPTQPRHPLPTASCSQSMSIAVKCILSCNDTLPLAVYIAEYSNNKRSGVECICTHTHTHMKTHRSKEELNVSDFAFATEPTAALYAAMPR